MALREILAKFSYSINSGPLLVANKAIVGAIGNLKLLGAAFAGAAGVGAAKQFLQEAIDLGDALDKQSRQLGFSAETLQRWQVAADRSGVSSGALTKSFQQLQQNADMAGQGLQTQTELFKRLGVEVKDAGGNLKSADTLMLEMADGLQGLGSHTEKAAVAKQLLGRSGAALIPMFEGGAKGVEELLARIDQFGGPIGSDFVKRAAAAKDAQADWNTATQRLKTSLAISLLPAITGGLTKAAQWAGNIAKMADGTDFFRNALIALGVVLAGVAIKMALPFLPAILAFLKIALIIAILVLLVDDLITMFEGGDSAIGKLIDKLFGVGTTEKVVKSVTKAWKWFKTAIKDVGEELGDMFSEFNRGVNQFEDLPDLLAKDIERGRQTIIEKAAEFGPVAQMIVGYLVNPLGTLRDIMIGIGGDVVTGLVDGLRARLQYAINEAKNLGRSVINAAKDALGIKSPSRVFFEIGSMVPAGAVRGIESGQRGVDDALARLFGHPSAPARGAGGSITQHNSWNISTPGGGGPSDYARAVIEKSRELMREERESAMAAVARYAEV